MQPVPIAHRNDMFAIAYAIAERFNDHNGAVPRLQLFTE